ncbi:hypothetical protein [Zhihengliuella salsuginis]|uniref:Uncharacterized protein n=1 Tax=Zhihengliuella salsuginis TaxID=578222 RepID=A0ABQ3GH38_9MICC|nr:hypothetical protein [Zhihengliuella salsuginis]GHD06251.1 hypothetical protein GCM10008096_16020 [Zhihengliuella salsuginis]
MRQSKLRWWDILGLLAFFIAVLAFAALPWFAGLWAAVLLPGVGDFREAVRPMAGWVIVGGVIPFVIVSDLVNRRLRRSALGLGPKALFVLGLFVELLVLSLLFYVVLTPWLAAVVGGVVATLASLAFRPVVDWLERRSPQGRRDGDGENPAES